MFGIALSLIFFVGLPVLLPHGDYAPESFTEGDIRTVISAEAAYQSESKGNGYPAAISCLLTPSNPECIPGYPATAPTFLDSNLKGH